MAPSCPLWWVMSTALRQARKSHSRMAVVRDTQLCSKLSNASWGGPHIRSYSISLSKVKGFPFANPFFANALLPLKLVLQLHQVSASQFVLFPHRKRLKRLKWANSITPRRQREQRYASEPRVRQRDCHCKPRMLFGSNSANIQILNMRKCSTARMSTWHLHAFLTIPPKGPFSNYCLFPQEMPF